MGCMYTSLLGGELLQQFWRLVCDFTHFIFFQKEEDRKMRGNLSAPGSLPCASGVYRQQKQTQGCLLLLVAVSARVCKQILRGEKEWINECAVRLAGKSCGYICTKKTQPIERRKEVLKVNRFYLSLASPSHIQPRRRQKRRKYSGGCFKVHEHKLVNSIEKDKYFNFHSLC